jgi:hypothetical protein
MNGGFLHPFNQNFPDSHKVSDKIVRDYRNQDRQEALKSLRNLSNFASMSSL